MDKIDYINNFEYFKMANELATELYPEEAEDKAEREMLIDYKAVIRKVLKSKSKIIAHDKADTLLKFLNPKRKWPWDHGQTLTMTYEIEPSFEVFFELRDKMDAVMEELHMDPSYKDRYVNVGFSGGEKKKSEILQLLMLEPELAILDETDSGLDVDAIDVVGRGIEKFRERDNSSLIVITHHHEILRHVYSDYVHVIMDGKLVKTGTEDLMQRIDAEGFGFLRG